MFDEENEEREDATYFRYVVARKDYKGYRGFVALKGDLIRRTSGFYYTPGEGREYADPDIRFIGGGPNRPPEYRGVGISEYHWEKKYRKFANDPVVRERHRLQRVEQKARLTNNLEEKVSLLLEVLAGIDAWEATYGVPLRFHWETKVERAYYEKMLVEAEAAIVTRDFVEKSKAFRNVGDTFDFGGEGWTLTANTSRYTEFNKTWYYFSNYTSASGQTRAVQTRADCWMYEPKY